MRALGFRRIDSAAESRQSREERRPHLPRWLEHRSCPHPVMANSREDFLVCRFQNSETQRSPGTPSAEIIKRVRIVIPEFTAPLQEVPTLAVAHIVERLIGARKASLAVRVSQRETTKSAHSRQAVIGPQSERVHQPEAVEHAGTSAIKLQISTIGPKANSFTSLSVSVEVKAIDAFCVRW